MTVFSIRSFRWLMPPLLALALTACGNSQQEAGHDHDDNGAHEEEARTGEHGGRLLEQGEVTVELAIVEDGAPAKLQAWLYRDDKPLPASAGSVEVHLKRLGGASETHVLKPRPDGSLLGDAVIAEPHSFDVEVRAKVANQSPQWSYESYEGRTTIAPAIAEEVGIRVASAGAAEIADEHEVQGLLTPIEGRAARIAARFPGPVRSLRAKVGDPVRAGQTLATIESNLSLTTYAVTTPISGVVLARNAEIGAVAAEGATLFEVADLSSLWVDLHVFGFDAQHIQAGAPVTLTRMSDGVTTTTTLERVLPGVATASQSTIARATISNEDGQWRPGAAVTARITVDRQPAAIVVPLDALQSFRDNDAVFVRVGDIYEARPVKLGKRDAKQVEVLSGLNAGDQVVIAQSYVVKADIEKSGASHEH